ADVDLKCAVHLENSLRHEFRRHLVSIQLSNDIDRVGKIFVVCHPKHARRSTEPVIARSPDFPREGNRKRVADVFRVGEFTEYRSATAIPAAVEQRLALGSRQSLELLQVIAAQQMHVVVYPCWDESPVKSRCLICTGAI